MPSGLLRHHCCYPLCPRYLTSFRTDVDFARGTRRGIFAHLDLDLYDVLPSVPAVLMACIVVRLHVAYARHVYG